MSTSSDEFMRMLRQLRDGYLADMPGRIDTIEALILDIGKGGNFSELFETLYREVHSMKGSAGTHGLHLVSTICHNIEDKLTEHGESKAGFSQPVVQNLLALVDLLHRCGERYADPDADLADLEQALEALRYIGSTAKYSALIVEPSALHRKMCEEVFTKKGFSFARAADGYEALGRLLSEPFDLLITGKEIARFDGPALVGALRMSKCANRNITTIMLTSSKKHDYVRSTDPSYVVVKDSKMLESLNWIIDEALATIASRDKG